MFARVRRRRSLFISGASFVQRGVIFRAMPNGVEKPHRARLSAALICWLARARAHVGWRRMSLRACLCVACLPLPESNWPYTRARSVAIDGASSCRTHTHTMIARRRVIRTRTHKRCYLQRKKLINSSSPRRERRRRRRRRQRACSLACSRARQLLVAGAAMRARPQANMGDTEFTS